MIRRKIALAISSLVLVSTGVLANCPDSKEFYVNGTVTAPAGWIVEENHTSYLGIDYFEPTVIVWNEKSANDNKFICSYKDHADVGAEVTLRSINSNNTPPQGGKWFINTINNQKRGLCFAERKAENCPF